MKKGYLYLVFITLSSVVVLAIALVFKLSTTTDRTNIATSINDYDSNELHALIEVQNYDDSWIQRLSREKNQKEYLYPIQKFYIEFN
ncbi:MAG TPA: hypothetical protein EYG75_06845 [Campylobacterales bacterium]|nr:hypothetical protein [Campylobacterales bacterium]